MTTRNKEKIFKFGNNVVQASASIYNDEDGYRDITFTLNTTSNMNNMYAYNKTETNKLLKQLTTLVNNIDDMYWFILDNNPFDPTNVVVKNTPKKTKKAKKESE